MHPNEELIERFYQSFNKRDAEGMIACYHDDVVFSDPVFQTLNSAEARSMWRMLAGRSQDLAVTYRNIHADDRSGSGYWEATYTFTQTGRKVLNKVTSAFQFKDGKIIAHHDTFDLYKWAGMALGPIGRIAGWSAPLQSRIRQRARAGLDDFMRTHKIPA